MRCLMLVGSAMALLALPGCALNSQLPVPLPVPGALTTATTAGGSAPTDPVVVLQNFVVDDLQNALADAKANNDVVAANCWAALIPAAQNVAPGAPVPVTGGVSAFQKARDIAEKVNQGIPQGLNIACAPLVLSSQATILQLSSMLGIKIP